VASTPLTTFRFTPDDLRALAKLQRLVQRRTLGKVTRIGAIRYAVQATVAAEEKAK
jgi:hypothetical protein